MSRPKRKRTRDGEGTGKTDHSHRKHALLRRVAQGQAYAYQKTHPSDHLLILDMHAGDGAGVPQPQLEFFEPTAPLSIPTANLACELAASLHNTHVILCEQSARKRAALQARWPTAQILANHTDLLSFAFRAYQWVLVLNDPNGYAAHGPEVLEHIGRSIAADFVIVVNTHALKRLQGVDPAPQDGDTPAVRAVRAKWPSYAWMLDPQVWRQRVGRTHAAVTPDIRASANFHYRLLVLANGLSTQVQRPPFEVIA